MIASARRLSAAVSRLTLFAGGVAGTAIMLMVWWFLPGNLPKDASPRIGRVEATTQAPSQVQLADDEKTLMRNMLQQEASVGEADFDRQVWVADLMNVIGSRRSDRDEVANIAALVHRHATRFDLSPELVLAVMAVESNFDRFAVSRAGARGLMQVMPFWKRDIGSADDNLFDLETNIRYGCAILKIYLDRHGKTATALAAYNGSLGNNKYPLRVFKQMRYFKAAAGDLRS
ncbi:MAG: lytic transglycosylase domain-containing protein [Mariprofundaceae bacterium]